MISVVLGSYNRKNFLIKAIESVRSDINLLPYEIIVIDGGSDDGSIKYLQKQKDIISIIQHNRGTFRGEDLTRRSWGYFMNLGFKIAQGKYILMISDDCLLVKNTIESGVELFEKLLNKGERVGALAFYWRNWPDDNKYKVGLTLGDKMTVNHGMYLRTALDEVGWIDEKTYQFYHADGDLCLKLWKNGYQVLDCKSSFIEHFNHLKPNPISNKKDWNSYLKKWSGVYFDPKKNNYGSWIYLDNDDQNKTFKSFPRWAIYKYKFYKFFIGVKHLIYSQLRRIKDFVT